MSQNLIHLEGNLVEDVQLRFTRNGEAVANFRIAVNRTYTYNNEQRSDVEYVSVVAWRQLGENVSTSVGRGDRVVLSGRLQQRKVELRDGSYGYFTEVVATSVAVSLRWATVDSIVRTNGRPSSTDRQEAADASGLGERVAAGSDVAIYGAEEPF